MTRSLALLAFIAAATARPAVAVGATCPNVTTFAPLAPSVVRRYPSRGRRAPRHSEFSKGQPSAASAATDLNPPPRVDSQATMSTEPDQLEWIVSGDKVRSRDGDLASRNFRGDDVRLQI
jgi:hypothetical protein